jgi:hypothetical protein
MPDNPKTWEEALLLVSGKRLDLCMQRHYKYGPGNIAAFGLLGVVIRLSDKIERLKTAIETAVKDDGWNGNLASLTFADTHADETVIDTLSDVGNYADIARMLMAGYWHLPIEGDQSMITALVPKRAPPKPARIYPRHGETDDPEAYK